MTTLTTFVAGSKPKESIIRHKKAGEDKKIQIEESQEEEGMENEFGNEQQGDLVSPGQSIFLIDQQVFAKVNSMVDEGLYSCSVKDEETMLELN